ncbi:M23 family metallopeptidase [uncultured Alistipes sp.]|uniref:M23 family metallopeptidase n=1 Tax=uncultured Alistipes sp. TaxID=538949 RepID=UPI0025D002E7|nr:M23 family metallopeptidase [uncultured Alistipes sp.]
MKPVLLAAWLLLCCGGVSAQPQILAKETPDGKRTDFFLEKKDRPGTLTVFLTFTELHNCTSRPGTTRHEVRHDMSRLTSLRAADESYGVGYRYTWRYFYGPINPDADTAFVYRMPCSECKPVRVVRTVYVLDKYRKAPDEQQQLGYHFALEKGDTVYAMRRGTVTRVDVREKSGADVSFTTKSTDMTVEHPDGSFAWYICLDCDGLFVREGDEVLPSEPLGLAGSYDGEHYKVSVQTYWYVSNPDSEKRREQPAVMRRFFPRFATTDGVLVPEHGGIYTPVATREMVTREMTKKELKKFRSAGAASGE